MFSPAVAKRGACTEHLDLVDAAFARQGSPAQRKLEREFCPTCPIAKECLYAGLDNGEYGPWGGTNKTIRNKHVRRPDLYNMRNVEHPYARATEPTGERQLVTYNGVTSRQIKVWAVEVGLLDYVGRGTVRREIREAYHAAHESAAS